MIYLAPNLLRDQENGQILQPENLKNILKDLKNDKNSELEACSDLLSTLRFFCHPAEQIVLNEKAKETEENQEVSEPEGVDYLISNIMERFNHRVKGKVYHQSPTT